MIDTAQEVKTLNVAISYKGNYVLMPSEIKRLLLQNNRFIRSVEVIKMEVNNE